MKNKQFCALCLKFGDMIFDECDSIWVCRKCAEEKLGYSFSKKKTNGVVCEGCGEDILEGQAIVGGEKRHSVCS